VLAPPGHYRLSPQRPWFQFLDRGELPARLLHLSAELIDATVWPTGLTVRYRSPGRAVLLVNQKPISVRMNGRVAEVSVEGGDGRWALSLPRGEHELEIETASRAGVLVSIWSYVSASAIVAFGAVSTLLMAALYLRLRFRPVWKRFVAKRAASFFRVLPFFVVILLAASAPAQEKRRISAPISFYDDADIPMRGVLNVSEYFSYTKVPAGRDLSFPSTYLALGISNRVGLVYSRA